MLICRLSNWVLKIMRASANKMVGAFVIKYDFAIACKRG
nr:MAG TPA: hypothetical protein [Caudoviricetes sp.]DAK21771.1 MAG TPA: hypothetical protein [Caudoviricetes sp.]